MTRFHGVVGYGETTETAPGVWQDNIVEYPYFGDVVRHARNFQQGEQLNYDLTVTNSISIVADAYANENFHSIRYVHWGGQRWEVGEVEVQPPRLILRLGGVYNGQIPQPDPAPDAP